MNKEKLYKKIEDKFPSESFEIIEYLGMREPFQIKCLSCGTVYSFRAAQNFFARKWGCKKCVDSPEWARQKEKFKAWLMEHSEFELIDDLSRIHNSQQHVKCKCSICGRIQENKKVYDYYSGKKCFCQTKSTKKPQDQIAKDFEDICIFLEPYQNTDTPILVQSKLCNHIFKARPSHMLRNKYNCPICNSSIGEKRIIQFLEQNRFSYERQKKITIDGKTVKIDFYLPDYNMYIEYNGGQHYFPVEHFGGQQAFENQKSRDTMVRNYILGMKSQLIEIPYTDFEKIELILQEAINNAQLKRRD